MTEYQKSVLTQIKLLSEGWEESDRPMPKEPKQDISPMNRYWTEYWQTMLLWRKERDLRIGTRPRIRHELGLLRYLSVTLSVPLDSDIYDALRPLIPREYSVVQQSLEGGLLLPVRQRWHGIGVLLDWLEETETPHYVVTGYSDYAKDPHVLEEGWKTSLFVYLHVEVKP